jgi:transposase
MDTISQDLRERVLRSIQEGETTSEIAERYSVSPAWVRRFHQRFRATGSIEPLVRKDTRVPKLQPHQDRIRAMLEAQPDLTLDEIRRELALDVALSTIWLAIQNLGLTFKKKSSMPPSKNGPMSSKPAKTG